MVSPMIFHDLPIFSYDFPSKNHSSRMSQGFLQLALLREGFVAVAASQEGFGLPDGWMPRSHGFLGIL